MKKIYLSLTLICFLMLAVGTYAQTPKSISFGHGLTPIKVAHSSTRSTRMHKVQGGANNARLDYVLGDEVNDPSQTFFRWLPPLYMNMSYTLADTITSPLVSATANVNTANYCTVTFDTLWDDYTQSYLATPIAGTVTVDTIWADLAYHNTSNTTDSIIFQVCSVDINGLPSNTIYGSVTAHLTNVSLPYNVLDSFQSAYIVPATPISIPSSATHGWNFCIKMKVYGSKLDTLGVWYYSPGINCGFYITNGYTVMGVANGRDPNVNSFVSGLYWFNDVEWFGDGSQMTWPLFGQPAFNGWETPVNNVYYFYDNLPCADSSYFPEQDIALFASINYSLVPLGTNEVTSNNLSVSQNFPNPFSRQTQITYSLAASSDVAFSVYDIAGREIINNKYSAVAAGQHLITLNANQFSPGIYFYTFNVNGKQVTRKMVITQ